MSNQTDDWFQSLVRTIFHAPKSETDRRRMAHWPITELSRNFYESHELDLFMSDFTAHSKLIHVENKNRKNCLCRHSKIIEIAFLQTFESHIYPPNGLSIWQTDSPKWIPNVFSLFPIHSFHSAAPICRACTRPVHRQNRLKIILFILNRNHNV